MGYKTDIDYNIIQGSEMTPEILDYIEKNFTINDRASISFKSIYKFLCLICKMRKIQPSPEQFLYILTNKKRLLNEACAGAGKTTMTIYRMILANLFYGIRDKEILAVTFNTHARDDLKNKYEDIAKQLNANLQKTPYRVGKNIMTRGFQQWCREWVVTFKSRWKIVDIKLLEPEEVKNLLRVRTEAYIKKKEIQNVIINDSFLFAMQNTYNFVKETLSEDNEEAWNLCTSKEDLRGLTNSDLREIFSSYDKYKMLSKQMDMTDLVSKMYELVTDPECVKRIRYNYKFYVFDEYQDITPSMNRIIQALINGSPDKGIPPYTEAYLTCIGDGDQSIYGFRGTDPDNCIRFRDTFSLDGFENEVTITSMSINRRCKSEILNTAKGIIESVQNRIQKPIAYLNEGGHVETRTYQNNAEEILSVLKTLREFNELDGTKKQFNLSDTCICYRNNSSSTYMAMELFNNEIPYKILKGTKPLEDVYTKTLLDVLDMLDNALDIDCARKSLYKVLPKIPKCYSKTTIYNTLTEYLVSLRENPLLEKKHYWDFTFNGSENVQAFNVAMSYLKLGTMGIMRDLPMQNYMPKIIGMVLGNYMNPLINTIYRNILSPEYIEFINRFFCRNITYTKFLEEIKRKRTLLEEQENKGVRLTTMHGLKGLEFKNVIVLDMDDTIYPGRELSSKNLTEQQAVNIELESRRLLYVTVTRAKDNLILYFNKNCPSRYYQFFEKNNTLDELYSKYENNSYFIYDTGVEKLDKLSTVEDEYIFTDLETSALSLQPQPSQATSHFQSQSISPQPPQTNDVDDLFDEMLDNSTTLSDEDVDDLFDSLQDESQHNSQHNTQSSSSGILSNKVESMPTTPNIKSILDILGMKGTLNND